MALSRSEWKKSLLAKLNISTQPPVKPSVKPAVASSPPKETTSPKQKVTYWLRDQDGQEKSEGPPLSISNSVISKTFQKIPTEAMKVAEPSASADTVQRETEKEQGICGTAHTTALKTHRVLSMDLSEGLEARSATACHVLSRSPSAGHESENIKSMSVASPSLTTSPANKVFAVSSVGGANAVMKKDVSQSRDLVRRKLAFQRSSSRPVEIKIAPPSSIQDVPLKSIPTADNISQRPGGKRQLSPEKQTPDIVFNKQYVEIGNVLHGDAFAETASGLNIATTMDKLSVAHSPKVTAVLSSPKVTTTVSSSPVKEAPEPSHRAMEIVGAPVPMPRARTNTANSQLQPTPRPRTSLNQASPPLPTPRARTSINLQASPLLPTPRARTSPNHQASPSPPLPTPRPRALKTTHFVSPDSPLPAPKRPFVTPPFKGPSLSDVEHYQSIFLTPEMSAPDDFMDINENTIVLPLDMENIGDLEMESLFATPILATPGMVIVPPTPPETPEIDISMADSVIEEVLAIPFPEDLNDNDSVQDENIVHEHTPEKKTFRKREKRSSKQDKAKEALNKGLEHYNVKGQLIPARKIREGCKNCRFKCSEKISEDQRMIIFRKYWDLGEKVKQDAYIRECITVTEPAQHLVGDDVKRKSHTIKYSFKFPAIGQIFICKTMFLDTLGISESPVRTQMKKLERGITLASPDKRGRHSKIPPEVKEKNDNNIIEHIGLFKTVPSHFCRLRSKRKYLSAQLTIRHMWRLYKTWMVNNKPNDEIKSEKYYRRIFCTKFNLGFHKPKKDRCDLCLIYEIGTPAQKKKLKPKYDEHIRNKKNAKDARKKDELYAKTCRDTVCYCIMDLQQVISLPKTEAGMVFYKRKLSTYNFTIYERTHKKGHCYVWDESEAKRGANEIATCVLLFLAKKASEGIYEFIIWSDNCGGQNKNKYLFAAYTWAAANLNITITHRYMERGHTMNEADSMHATIERAARYEQIFEPKDLVPIIEKAKRRGKKYDVRLVGSEILDCHVLANDLQSWTNKSAKWKQVREITVDDEHPGKVFLRHDLTAPTSKEIKINKRGRPLNLTLYEFPKAFDGPLQLKVKKLKDLACLCNELVIPSHKHAFYQGLLNFPRLDNPLLLVDSGDEESEDEEALQTANNDFLFDYDNEDEKNLTDYEDEIEHAKQKTRNNEGEEDGDDEEADVDGDLIDAAEDADEVSSSSSIIYDEDSDTSEDANSY